jgi:hypothetical protein
MARFSATDAAFSGFRVVREHPKAVAVWAVALLALQLLTSLALVGPTGQALMQMQAAGPSRDPVQIMAQFHQMAPTYGLLVLITLVFNAVAYATMDRAVLRPEDDRLGYLRLGADELRQLGLTLLLGLLGIGLYILLALFIIVALIVVGVAVHTAPPVAASAVSAIVVVGLVCVFLFVVVRLSLASALTFATGRINVFGSWALTRGQFWPILGTYLLAVILTAVVMLLGYILIFAVVAVAGGGLGAIGALTRPDFSSWAAYLSPLRLVYLLATTLISALALPLTLAPQAAIYRGLTAA